VAQFREPSTGRVTGSSGESKTRAGIPQKRGRGRLKMLGELRRRGKGNHGEDPKSPRGGGKKKKETKSNYKGGVWEPSQMGGRVGNGERGSGLKNDDFSTCKKLKVQDGRMGV